VRRPLGVVQRLVVEFGLRDIDLPSRSVILHPARLGLPIIF
jgi:hypothetical protein